MSLPAVGGIVDVIKHEQTGLLVPEKNRRALAAAILRLLNDRELARHLGEAGRVYAEWQFNWDRIVDDTEALFRNAIEMQNSRRIGAGTKAALGIGVALCMAAAIRRTTGQVSNISFDPILLFAAFCVAVVYRLLNACGWALSLRALRSDFGTVKSARLWLTAETMRWLPGSVWNYVSRVYSATQAGVDAARASLSVSLELGLTVAAWLITAGFGLAATPRLAGYVPRPSGLIFAIIAAAVAFAYFAVSYSAKAGKLARDLRSLLQHPPRLGYCAAALLFYVALCALNGVIFHLVLAALTPNTPPLAATIGINAIAWLLGFFAFMAPGGLGVREAAITGMLSLFCPLPVAAASAILWRLLQVASELACLAPCILPSSNNQNNRTMNKLSKLLQPALEPRTRPFAVLVAATACLIILVGGTVILPAYKTPTNRTYTSRFRLRRLEARIKHPLPGPDGLGGQTRAASPAPGRGIPLHALAARARDPYGQDHHGRCRRGPVWPQGRRPRRAG